MEGDEEMLMARGVLFAKSVFLHEGKKQTSTETEDNFNCLLIHTTLHPRFCFLHHRVHRDCECWVSTFRLRLFFRFVSELGR